MAAMVKAFPDGIEIDQVFDVENLGENTSKEIKPDATIEVCLGFKL